MTPHHLSRRHILQLGVLATPLFAVEAWCKAPRRAVWSKRGNLQFFGAPDGIHWANADETRGGRLLPLGLSFALTPGSITVATDRLAYTALDRHTGSSIWTVPIKVRDNQVVAGKPEEFFRSGSFDVNPRFTADDRRIVYASRESGRWNVHARSFPDAGHAERVPGFNL